LGRKLHFIEPTQNRQKFQVKSLYIGGGIVVGASPFINIEMHYYKENLGAFK
jgi:hypothetical protein